MNKETVPVHYGRRALLVELHQPRQQIEALVEVTFSVNGGGGCQVDGSLPFLSQVGNEHVDEIFALAKLYEAVPRGRLVQGC